MGGAGVKPLSSSALFVGIGETLPFTRLHQY
jgi:hypothetical protein